MAGTEGTEVTLDGVEYSLANMSEAARTQIQNIAFCDERIQQLSNEWAVADTARIGYSNALKREAKKS